MSKSNENNRPQLSVLLGALSATREVPVLVAHKKMRVRNLSLMDITAVAASGTNYVTMRPKIDGVDAGVDVDTQAGLAAREPLDSDLGSDGYIDLEAGEVLSVNLTVAASGALTDAVLSADLEVIGN